MRKLILAAAVALLLPVSAQAATLNFPSDAPVATITIPDSWSPEETESGVQALSDDEAIYLAVDVADADSAESVVKEAFTFLGERDVKVDEATLSEKDLTINGMATKFLTWAGTDADGPVSITVGITTTADGKFLVLTYWGTQGEQEKHIADLDAILNSLASVN